MERSGNNLGHVMEPRKEVEFGFQARRTKQLRIAQLEAQAKVKQVVMGGSTIVTCGAGLNVQHIVCGYESCFLTIKHLPPNIRNSEVEGLLTQLDINHSFFHIVKLHKVNNEVQAKILLDSKVCQTIATGLNDMNVRDGHYLDISVGNEPTLKQDINVLTVNWTLPSSTTIAQYNTEEEAVDALKRLNNTMFRRRKIRAERYSATNPGAPTIKISGLPVNITTAEVEEYSGAHAARILTANPGHDLSQIIERISGFEGYEVNLPNLHKFDAEVRFQFGTWDDAKRAQISLEGWRFRADYPPLHVWLPMPIQYIVTMSSLQYHAQKALWDSMPVEKDNDKSAFVRVIDETNKTSVLVLGEDKRVVGQLKVRVANLLAGETLDWRLWHRSFIDAPGRAFLNSINSRTNAYVRVDLKSKTLRLYTDRDMKQTVIALIQAHIVRLELSEYPVPIPPSVTGFFICKGLRMLKEELGEDAVRLDLHPITRAIVCGKEEALKTVDRLIEASLNSIEYGPYIGEHDTCPVCFCKPSSPVLLVCGHVYCAECMKHFFSTAEEGKMFPLACSGNEARCRVPIAIPVIRRFLTQQQFDQLIEAAVKNYVEKQPAKFQNCPTPGCMQFYRCRKDNSTLTCPSCFATVCGSCHREAHEGITCQKTMDPREEELLNETWARGAGAKRCPSCRIWIQKTDGCNHVSCRCGTHICWNCLATFSNSEDVYDHLRTVHGGIYDDNFQTAGLFVPEIYLDHAERLRQLALDLDVDYRDYDSDDDDDDDNNDNNDNNDNDDDDDNVDNDNNDNDDNDWWKIEDGYVQGQDQVRPRRAVRWRLPVFRRLLPRLFGSNGTDVTG